MSRLKLVLIVVCLIAIPLTFWLNHRDVGSVNNRVTKVESPCLRYGPDSKICEHAFEEAAASINHRMACFFQHRAGVFPSSCRGVHLRIKQEPALHKGGDALQAGSTGHQPPSPQHGGSPGHGHTKHPPTSHPTPSPVPSPPAAPSPASPEPSLPPQASPHAEPPGLNHADPPGLLPSTVEAAGNAVGGAVGKADEAICTVRGLLKPCP